MNEIHKPFSNILDLILFQDLLKEYFISRGYSDVVIDEKGEITLDGQANTRYGVWNLAKLCALQPSHEWKETITIYFEKIAHSLRESDLGCSSEDVISKIRIQLYPQSYLESFSTEDKLVYRCDIPDTISVAVINFPTSLQNLRKSDLKRWSVDEGQIFEVALKNTLRSVTMHRDSLSIDKISFNYFEGSDLLTAVQVLDTKLMDTTVGAHGSIISIPTRHHIITYPFENSTVISAIHSLNSITSETNRTYPGSITPSVYWYHNCTFTKIPISSTNNKTEIELPQEFLNILALQNEESK